MLKAGRVGISNDEVDDFGKLKNTLKKEDLDIRLDDISFRDNDGKAQYRIADGEWENFSSGSLNVVKLDNGVGGTFKIITIQGKREHQTPYKITIYDDADKTNPKTYELSSLDGNNKVGMLIVEYTVGLNNSMYMTTSLSVSTRPQTYGGNVSYDSNKKVFVVDIFTDYLGVTFVRFEEYN